VLAVMKSPPGSIRITNAATGTVIGTATSAAVAIGALGAVTINNAGVVGSNTAYGAINDRKIRNRFTARWTASPGVAKRRRQQKAHRSARV
jgi:hypothetical protein